MSTGSLFQCGDFGTPSIYLERLKVDTSYRIHILNTTSASHHMTNSPLKWAWERSCNLNLKFGTPLLLLNG